MKSTLQESSKTTPIARHQMDKFLSKANLSDNIIEPEVQLKTVSENSIREANTTWQLTKQMLEPLKGLAEISEITTTAAGCQITGVSHDKEVLNMEIGNEQLKLLMKVGQDGDRLSRVLSTPVKGIQKPQSEIAEIRSTVVLAKTTLDMLQEAYQDESVKIVRGWEEREQSLSRLGDSINIMQDLKNLAAEKDKSEFEKLKAEIEGKLAQLGEVKAGLEKLAGEVDEKLGQNALLNFSEAADLKKVLAFSQVKTDYILQSFKSGFDRHSSRM